MSPTLQCCKALDHTEVWRTRNKIPMVETHFLSFLFFLFIVHIVHLLALWSIRGAYLALFREVRVLNIAPEWFVHIERIIPEPQHATQKRRPGPHICTNHYTGTFWRFWKKNRNMFSSLTLWDIIIVLIIIIIVAAVVAIVIHIAMLVLAKP